jgi:hypothetical protein
MVVPCSQLHSQLSNEGLWIFENNDMNESDLIFSIADPIEHTEYIDCYHTLNGFFALFRLPRFFFRPDDHNVLIEGTVPKVVMSDDHIGPLALHDHGVDQVLERTLQVYKFGHDKLVNIIDPSLHLLLIVDFWSENALDDVSDHLV